MELNRAPATVPDPGLAAVPTIHVHAAELGARAPAPRSGTIKALGLLLILVGVFVGSQTEQTWDRFLYPPSPGEFVIAPSDTAALPPLPSAVTGRAQAISERAWAELKLRWPFLILAAALIAMATFCLGVNPFDYFVSALACTIVAYLACRLLAPRIEQHFDTQPGWPLIVAFGAALAYLIHAFAAMRMPNTASLIGLGLTVLACFGVLRDWFQYPEAAQRFSGSAAEFVGQWDSEFKWGTVCLLTFIGIAFLSRNRLTHFLNAVLLLALAFACIHDGSLKIFEYPGTDWPSLAIRDLEYVDQWRWVLAAEFILLGGILLHLALGVGALTLAFAAVWFAAALHVDKEEGRNALFAYSRAYEVAMSRASPPTLMNAVGEAPDPALRRQGPADVLPMLGPRLRENGQAEIPLEYSFAQKKALMRKARLRIGVVFGWVYLTAFLAGIIGAAGIRMLLPNAGLRAWAAMAAWFVFGIVAYWLWTTWPPGQNWSSRLAAFALPKTHVAAVVAVAVGSLALFGAAAARSTAGYSKWLYTAAGVTFIGTTVTLIGFAVLIKYADFGQLETWAYAAIAFAQSILMWILLIHHTDRARRGLADT